LKPELELYLENFQGPTRGSKALKMSCDGNSLFCLSKGTSILSVRESEMINTAIKQTDSNISSNFIDFQPIKLQKTLTLSESGELCIFDFLGKLQFKLEITPSKKAIENGIKSFKNYEMTVCKNFKYVFVSCSIGEFLRTELKIYEIHGSEVSP
jgi:hypothetical protein